MNREEWLTTLARKLEPLSKAMLYEIPLYRVSVGFPKGSGEKHAGQRHPAEWSEDRHFEISIHPKESNQLEIAAILAHELGTSRTAIRIPGENRLSKIRTPSTSEATIAPTTLKAVVIFELCLRAEI
jgi:hypothetical protein